MGKYNDYFMEAWGCERVMVNDCSWYCENCNEELCEHCYIKKETNDGVILCEECFNGLDKLEEKE